MERIIPIIMLRPHVDADNRLVVHAVLEEEEFRLHSLTDIAKRYPDAERVTLHASDFYQSGAVYAVHGVTLAADGWSVAGFWTPSESGHGQTYTFELPPPDSDSSVAFVIGATARRGEARAPHPFESDGVRGGGLPVSVDPTKGSGQGGRG